MCVACVTSVIDFFSRLFTFCYVLRRGAILFLHAEFDAFHFVNRRSETTSSPSSRHTLSRAGHTNLLPRYVTLSTATFRRRSTNVTFPKNVMIQPFPIHALPFTTHPTQSSNHVLTVAKPKIVPSQSLNKTMRKEWPHWQTSTRVRGTDTPTRAARAVSTTGKSKSVDLQCRVARCPKPHVRKSK